MEVKLFTFEGMKVTIIHNLLFLGAAAAFVWVNVSLLGNDVVAEFGPSKQSAKK